ncbi:EKC/KEOPS complex subunit Tprkb [Brassica napus]|nr:EKC/KEOPS complex subunit Tprkb [Brassica napus]
MFCPCSSKKKVFQKNIIFCLNKLLIRRVCLYLEFRRFKTLIFSLLIAADLRVMKVFHLDGENTLSVSLFSDVTNSKELLNSMLDGSLKLEVSFLNALLIPDVFPLLAAAQKALVSKSRDSLSTRTLHSELVYNYSGSKHITESLKRCGISETTTYILAARFNASPIEMEEVAKLINGKEIDLEELKTQANQAHILKHYKITSQELVISSLGDAIVCRIAARDAL